MIRLSELLAVRGLTLDRKRLKLVRHKDSRFDVRTLRSTGWFDVYQSYQAKPVFDRCSAIVTFLGEHSSGSVFVGVYDVGARRGASEVPLPEGCPYPQWGTAGFHYPLVKRAGFEDLEARLVIDWGKGALAWHQWFSEREVIEIRPAGRLLPPFRDYLRVQLSFPELRHLVSEPTAHADWAAALSAVGGIYLIVDSVTGAQYVGSATGIGGLWSRWRDYALTGHGGNHRLRELCESSSRYPDAFTLSILETFSRNIALDEALTLESFFKRKLGSRAFGLNAN